MRVAPAIRLNDEKRKRLQTIARSPRQPLRLVQRARIVLLADRGLENIEIAERVNVSMALVGRWRRRYAESSFTGIEKDKTRAPGKPKTSPAIVQTILDKTMQDTPPAQTHWSQHSMAKVVGVSPSTVGRVWRPHEGQALAGAAPALPHALYTYQLIMAEHGRTIFSRYYNTGDSTRACSGVSTS